MKNPWLFPTAALTIGALGGFFAGKNTTPAPAGGGDDSPVARIRSQARAEMGGTDGRRPTSGSRSRGPDDSRHAAGKSNGIDALLAFYSGLSVAQFEAEAAKLEDLPMAERMMNSILLFGKWAETDPTGAMAYASKMGMQGGFVRPMILQSWASNDPQGAAAYYSKNPREFAMMGGGRGPMGGSSGASMIAGEWAKLDPDGAMAWANSLTGSDKNSALSGLVREVANGDPAKAWGLVAQMDAQSQSRAYRDIAEKWGAKDFAEAERQIASLPADKRADALSAALDGLARKDPGQAVQKLSSLPAGESRDDATRTAVDYWSRTNAREAAAWVAGSADESAKAPAMRELMPNYVAQDANGALAFAKGLPAGETRDSALSSYVFSNRAMAPVERLQIAQTIGDEESRTRTMTMAAGVWMREDAKAANDFIQSSDAFAEDVKKRAAAGEPLWGGGDGWRRGGRGPGG